MHPYCILVCFIVCAAGFFAGCFYGNKIATDIRAEEQKAVVAATTELKAVRGEIINFIREHAPKL